MKHLLSIAVSALCALAAAVSPATAETRVQASSAAPVHARPDSASPVLATANPGEIFFADHDEGAWTAVAPPDRVALWIHSDFVDGTRVEAKTVQLRTAPSLSSDVAGSLSRGATILQRGKQGDWLQIAPPSSALVYIETSRLSPVAQRTEPVREIPEEPLYVPTPEPVPEPTPPAAPAYTPAPPPPPPAIEPAPLPTPVIAASVPGASSSRPAAQTTQPAPPVSASPAPSPVSPSVPAPAPAPRPSVAATPAPSATPAAAAHPNAPRTAAPAHRAAPPAEHVTPPSELRRPLAEAPSGHTPVVAPSQPASAPPSTRPSPLVVNQSLIDDLNLVDTPNQGKAVKVEGELRLAPFTKGSPSRYRLLVPGPHSMQMLCHVHGHPADLRPYIGRRVSIRGKAFRVADSDMPVVVVGKLVPIDPDPDPDTEGFHF